MRKEMEHTLDGAFPEIAKGQITVLRKMKRQSTDPIIIDPTDPNYNVDLIKRFHAREQISDFFVPGEGYLIPCKCVDATTGESDIDNFCPICLGEGYIWKEIFMTCYKKILGSDVGKSKKEKLLEPGLTNVPIVVFYTRSSVQVTRADKIVEVWTDTEGELLKPYRRKALFRIGASVELRADNGRLEYRKIDCFEEKRKYLNGPRVG
jgi:hypothetical protein